MAADRGNGIITDEKLTRAAGGQDTDPAVAAEFLAAEVGGGAAPGTAGRQAGCAAGVTRMTLIWLAPTAPARLRLRLGGHWRVRGVRGASRAAG